ncbi:MAG: hypothetical protein LBG81_01530 [Coriobacteriaceae bacterium]|nr:hypothetical protein [Coriobacteriaceae bacterium]
MNQELSGGAKVGYFALGFLLGLIGVLIAFLVNKDKEQKIKSDALKFSIIGLVVTFVLGIVLSVTVLVPTMSILTSSIARF